MGDSVDRARAWRGLGMGVFFAVLAVLATVALAIAIPTEGENPRAWGVIGCGILTVGICTQLALRNWRRIRHFRGDDLPNVHSGERNQTYG